MAFLILFTIPLFIGIGGFILLKGITWREFALQVVAQIIVAGMSSWLIYHSNTSDTEIWNGTVTGKKKVWTSCEHSYQCNCRRECSGSGKNETCSNVCDTCYDHSNDWDWDVYSSIDHTITINRIDRRGSDEPPRWTAVKIGEPMSVTNTYENYIKAAPGTLFRHQGLQEKYARFIPNYPGEIYDYYRLNRLVLVNGAQVPNPGAWNQSLSVINGRLGSQRQSNIILVLANDLPADYFYALEEAWIGAKKNDTVLVVGTDKQLTPRWATVMAWNSNKLFEIKLRDDIMDLPSLTQDKVINALSRNVGTYYKRKPMADFEYLAASITPTPTQWTISLLISLIIAGVLTYVFHTKDIFNEEWRTQHFSKRYKHRF